MQTKVVHCKKEAFDVYIGRPGKWGNPFNIGRDGDRASVIAKHKAWIVEQPELMDSLHEIQGKRIACWCAPLACHGNTLAELADEYAPAARGAP